jgi:hypothetical protein
MLMEIDQQRVLPGREGIAPILKQCEAKWSTLSAQEGFPEHEEDKIQTLVGASETTTATQEKETMPEHSLSSLYSCDFEVPLIAATESYYKNESQRVAAASSVSEYIKKVEKSLNDEAERVRQYLSPVTEEKLVRIVEKEMIKEQFTFLLNVILFYSLYSLFFCSFIRLFHICFRNRLLDCPI